MYNTRNITNIYFKNYQWSITFKNCESLYYTSVTYSIKHQLYFSKKKKNSSVGKESTCNAGDPSSIPGWGNLLENG